MNTTHQQIVLSRINEIEQELITTPVPKLGVGSIEDVDELYQAKLEYNWWRDDIESELKALKEEIEILDK